MSGFEQGILDKGLTRFLRRGHFEGVLPNQLFCFGEKGFEFLNFVRVTTGKDNFIAR
jgi:hypothetical protein